jgi:hypothetical protein
METEELAEIGEKVHNPVERRIGLTMAIIAALLATVTLLGHRAHTKEVVLQTEAADQWAYYQAKNGRYHMYAADAKLARLVGPQGAEIAAEWKGKAEEEKKEAEEIQRDAKRLDQDTKTIEHRANYFDGAEICLEVAIVLCSIALLTGTLAFWQLSFVGAAIGVVIAAVGYLR